MQSWFEKLGGKGMLLIDLSNYCKELLIREPETLKKGDLYFNAVDDGDSRIIAAAGAVKVVVKDPLFAILEENSSITHPSRYLGGPCLHHNPASP